MEGWGCGWEGGGVGGEALGVSRMGRMGRVERVWWGRRYQCERLELGREMKCARQYISSQNTDYLLPTNQIKSHHHFNLPKSALTSTSPSSSTTFPLSHSRPSPFFLHTTSSSPCTSPLSHFLT